MLKSECRIEEKLKLSDAIGKREVCSEYRIFLHVLSQGSYGKDCSRVGDWRKPPSVMENWRRVVGTLQKRQKDLSGHFFPKDKYLKCLEIEAGQQILYFENSTKTHCAGRKVKEEPSILGLWARGHKKSPTTGKDSDH